jgi:hypothetical protein
MVGMMNGLPRRLRRILLSGSTALLAIGLGVPPASATPTAATPAVPVRLLAPGEGTVLRAGSTATLDWAPLGSLARQGEWEEWEAFLSLDGGATYTVRLTPHLDRRLSRITFRVPDLPTPNGRLLLRVGDEQRERAFELPERLTIAGPSTIPAGAGLPVAGALELTRTVWRRGEPARPGEPGVLVWVEGSRDGGSRREVVAAEPVEARPASPFLVLGSSRMPTAVGAEAPPSGAPAADPGVLGVLPPLRLAAAARPGAPPAASPDLLLLLQRQNE